MISLLRRLGLPELEMGGWSDKWLTQTELQAMHDRALAHSYHDAPTDNAGWIPRQCGGCRTYAAFNADWGICCNPASPKDLTLCFEHGGCDKHSDLEAT